MAALWQQLRFAVRVLGKNPSFTLVAILSLAFGIGANTAIFTLLDQVLLRPLPAVAPEQLVVLRFTGAEEGSLSSRDDGELYFSYPMYRDLRDRNTVFSGMLATVNSEIAVNWRGQTEHAGGELISGNYFDVLGVRPALGRLFQQSDDITPEANPLAVLSYGYWQRRFGGDASVLNQNIGLNGHPFTVIGVAPPGFQSVVVGDTPDVFAPMMMKAQITPGRGDLDERRSRWLNIVARLKPGVTVQQAEAGMNPLWYSLREMELGQMKHPSQRLQTEFMKTHLSLLDGAKGLSPLRHEFATPLVALMAMVGLVLLIACANVANLLLARGASRQREIAIRFALGASRLQVMRQMVTESLVLAAAGGVLGVALASWLAQLLLRALPAESHLQVAFSGRPDFRTLAFTLAVTAITGIVFGLAPAFQAAHSGIGLALKEQAGSVTGGGGQARFRKLLVAAQTGLSLLLMVGAGLFARSLYNLKSQNLGFRADHLLAFDVNPKLNGYNGPQILALYDRLLQAMGSEPGVRTVACSRLGLMSGNNSGSNITVAGYHDKEGEDMTPRRNEVSPGYFSALGVQLIAGREFTAADAQGSPKVAIVNEKFERYFFGNESAVGHWFGFGGGNGVKTDIQIVGVAKDGKYASMRQVTPRFLYLPYLQGKNPGAMSFYVRTAQDPAQAAGAVRREVQRLDPNLPVTNLATMDQLIDDNIWLDRVVAVLSMSFGLLATALAAIGLYGVLAYTVARRTREIGIRLALGATRARILRLVMAEVSLVAGAGIVVAIPVSLALTRYLKSQLFGLSNADPLTLAGAALFLALVGVFAGYLPARRATRVDPVTALRWE
ncbi:MAG TPA: ABC transporter permease [Bryobacteraceae bacterium]|nr:ABC transporter permease [Bryobacteraceae bacterium]